jgi:hypothetical protein
MYIERVSTTKNEMSGNKMDEVIKQIDSLLDSWFV